MMNRFLLEIGSEEIPAGYIQPALSALTTIIEKKLSDFRIEHAQARTYGTPRRLTIIIDDVAGRQLPLVIEIFGPPEAIGFDANGQPTVPARKFAEKNAVPVDQIKVKDTGKGRYLYAVKTEPGDATIKILSKILPDIILSIPFPKTMRWSDQRFQFARPIHSICALLGSKVIPFQLGNIQSNRYTFGHRFLSQGKIKLSLADEYLDALSSEYVLADIQQRREVLCQKMLSAVETAGGKILPDEGLVDIVVNLVEFPVPVVGSFDRKFLEIPGEILITAMREHQKYFAVVDSNNKLMPYFVAVNNTKARDMKLVASGHERVLRARLTDAQFFYQADSSIPLDEMAGKLQSVMFQAELGSVYDKTLRIEKLAAKLSELLNLDGSEKSRISRAAILCKSDLVSHVVGEFPKLQGIMGRIYASNVSEPAEVSAAIEEHYRPTYSGGPLPDTLEGAVVSIADKLDSICGFFSIGLIPTGASDPHALRRQGIGIIQISLDKNFAFPLRELIESSASMFSGKESLCDDVLDFLKGRMSHLLEESGISKDMVAAILSVPVKNVVDVWKRAHAIQQLKALPDFEILATAFKRVVNIIRKSDAEDIGARGVDETLFAHPTESALFEKFKMISRTVVELIDRGDINRSFAEIATLRPSVDLFFDDVMVMDENLNLRKNRLALLLEISKLFEMLADFSKITTQ
jgi:glycyl-tRNA synthetase beta chain